MPTKLQNKVFKEVCKIPKGQTRTYKQIAEKLNTSPRVVARILSQNVYPIKIPCHRVIRSDGKIGGYTYKGKRKDEMKAVLLREEGVKIDNKKIIKK
jgi:methylated-DNA-[protein]-cysteine S-methyltransferase